LVFDKVIQKDKRWTFFWDTVGRGGRKVWAGKEGKRERETGKKGSQSKLRRVCRW